MIASEYLSSMLKLVSPESIRLSSRENSQLEFKQSFNWGSKAMYAKTLAAFANNKGGFIVFGVTNSPREILGLRNQNFENHDEAVASQYLNTNFSPAMDFEKGTIALANQTLGFIYVHPAERKPVICTQNDSENKEGDIYFRYKGRSQRIRYPELAEIMSLIKQAESDRWLSLLERIGRIGVDRAALLDTYSGKIEGDKGTLLIDESLLAKIKFVQEGKFREAGRPTLRLIGDVRPMNTQAPPQQTFAVTNEPGAPVVQLTEEDFRKNFPLDYGELTAAMRNRYTNFKENQTYHDQRKQLAKNPAYRMVRYLDPDKKDGTKKDWYSELILGEFDKLYTKRPGI